MSRLTVLGTGDSTALDYWNSGYLITGLSGQRLAIDAGFTIKYALRERGMCLAALDAVFITHLHGDHVHGLERIGYESRYGYGKRVKLHGTAEILHKLWHECLFGTMGYSSSGQNSLSDFFEPVVVEDQAFRFDGVNFRLFPTPHTAGKDSFGLVLNDKLIVTADTRCMPWLAEDRSSRPIIHDCSLYRGNPAHATLWELKEQYPETVRRRLWAVHYGDDIEQYRAEIERDFAGVAFQGQEFAL
ncbi:MAG: MBL fold metallo-hydrolase [Gammaproteobacteria bacterium]|nr:MBL fold metallo-hydrolase [Gammaproteobacteria bacterium]